MSMPESLNVHWEFKHEEYDEGADEGIILG